MHEPKSSLEMYRALLGQLNSENSIQVNRKEICSNLDNFRHYLRIVVGVLSPKDGYELIFSLLETILRIQLINVVPKLDWLEDILLIMKSSNLDRIRAICQDERLSGPRYYEPIDDIFVQLKALASLKGWNAPDPPDMVSAMLVSIGIELTDASYQLASAFNNPIDYAQMRINQYWAETEEGPRPHDKEGVGVEMPMAQMFELFKEQLTIASKNSIENKTTG